MAEKPPNILLIVVDCLRADRLTREAGDAVTPFLDEAVGRGVLFEKTMSVNSFTLPCMTSYLTGLYPFHHGLRVQEAGRLRDEHRLLAEWLKPLGYYTHARIGGAVGSEHGFDRGIDHYEQGHRDASFQERWGPAIIQDLQARRIEEPWFCYLHILDIHEPRVIPPEFDKARFGALPYDRALSAIDPWLRRTVEAAGNETLVIITGDHGEGLSLSRKARLLERFVGLRGVVDRTLRTVLKPWWRRIRPRLTQAKRQVMLSHGGDPEQIRGHGWACYDVHVRVPLLLLNVNGARPQRIAQMVRTVDLTPTLLDLVGAAGWQEAGLDGVSLRPLLEWRELPPLEAYVECSLGHIGNVPDDQWRMAVRTDAAKYICSPFADDKREELFDLTADPKETRNIAGESPALLADLRQRLRAISPEVAAGKFGAGAATTDALSAEDAAAVEERLRDLGYVD
jgi:arylsulfatase A-like enzyme